MLLPEYQHAVEPIAILGMGCRFPGDSTGSVDIETPEELWDFVQRKGDAYADFPKDRLNIDAWYHPEVGHPGSFYTRGGCFLKKSPYRFDPGFFNISPHEAKTMDPAQRKLLEVVYEAFEASGTPLSKLSGSNTGCFIGNFNYDHQLMQFRDSDYPQPYAMTGGGIAILSNRISYTFNLQGPSLTLDTACSSSLYALHLACSAIQSGDCTAAIVGGSNLILTPECQTFSAALGSVSHSSRCHTFDTAADGYARAEGIAVLYIKSLKQAILDRDPVQAIIRSTAVNANGRTGGITHPDAGGQERVIRRAYQRAGGLDPTLTSYFECHGTGTPVGDPIEVEAVGRVFAKDRSAEQPLWIGSIKSNMGHCEAASGMAGVIKTVMALQKMIIPPVRTLKILNPNLNLHGSRLRVVTESTPWPEVAVRRASVNSSGYGGANGHIILEEAPKVTDKNSATLSKMATKMSSTHIASKDRKLRLYKTSDVSGLRHRGYFLLPFSAHNEQTLRHNMEAIASQVKNWRGADLEYTLACRRSVFSVRSYVVASREQIEASRLPLDDVATSKVSLSSAIKIGFIFTGQGAQAPGMAKELMENFPVYLISIRYMDSILSRLVDGPEWSIEEELQASLGDSRVAEASMSQPLVTAVQVALVDLLRSWNITSIVNVGHSSGEIASAYASGKISAATAILIAYARGKAVARNARPGAMLAVGTTLSKLKPLLMQASGVEIACYNSPESFTLSGEPQAIAEMKRLLDSHSIFARPVQTGGNAYHSSHMKPIGSRYEEDLGMILASLELKHRSRLLSESKFISSVGKLGQACHPHNVHYWRQNLECPVMFDEAIRTMVDSSLVDIVIEIGPHSALRGPLRQIFESMPNAAAIEYVPTVVRGKDSAECLMHTAGTLWMKGYSVDFASLHVNQDDKTEFASNLSGTSSAVIVDLPKYQWQYGNLLHSENRWTREWRLKTHQHHDILGSRQPGGNQNEPTWRNILKLKHLPWLRDHKVGPDVVFPAAGYVIMAVEAALQIAELKGIPRAKIAQCLCENIDIASALTVPENDDGVEVLFSLSRFRLGKGACREDRYNFTVTSVIWSGNGYVFTDHAFGNVISIPCDNSLGSVLRIDQKKSLQRPISVNRWYDVFNSVGLEYGATFQGISNVTVSEEDHVVTGQINMGTTKQVLKHESFYPVHPASLDSAIQVAIIAAHRGRSTRCTTAFLPVSLDKISINVSEIFNGTARVNVTSSTPDDSGFVTDFNMYCPNGNTIAQVEGLHFTPISIVPLVENQQIPSPYTRLVWQPKIDLLRQDNGVMYHSPAGFESAPDRHLLDELALTLLLQFHASHQIIFSKGSKDATLQRYLAWMKEKADGAAKISIAGGVQKFNQSISQRKTTISDLLSKLLHSHAPEARLMYHMYQNLPKIFSGEIAGIAVAVQNDYLSNLYQTMGLYRRGSDALNRVVAMICHNNPNQAIFEVGGGTGSATRLILRALRGDRSYRSYSTYTFTDVSKSFLGDAQEEFKDFAGVKYGLFDMERPASQQGFDASHDLVIASNVIHATSDMRATLLNVRNLLKPGGKLVLFEIVRPTLFWMMILGTFPGAWKGDHDPSCPRTEGPFLTLSQWKDVLPRCGFSGVDLTFDYFDEHRDAAVLVATAVEPENQPPAMAMAASVTIVHRGHPSLFVQQCQKYLQQKQNYSVNLLDLHSVKSLMSIRRVIALVEVDRPLFTEMSNAEWMGARTVLTSSKSVLWVTRGSLLKGQSPGSAIIGGIVATLHAEDQSSRLLTLDLDQEEVPYEHQIETIVQLEKRAVQFHPGDDFEYRSKDGVIHISRVLVEDDLGGAVDQLQPRNNAKSSSGQRSLNHSGSLRAPSEQGIREWNHERIQRDGFDPAGSYILVGCTGTLGQSLANWMVSRGAGHLIFLSRTGAADPRVGRFLKSLKTSGAVVSMVQGDVASPQAVATAVAAAVYPIRGVVQAPLTLLDTLFRNMSHDEFNATFAPRVTGTLNLHHATANFNLDFFFTLTSWTKVLGSPSQANYAASSAFMDAFAAHRQSLGLPGTSLSLGHMLDIGIVAYNLPYQENLLQMGLYGNDEREFLLYCEAALLSYPSSAVPDGDKLWVGNGHILAGMSPSGLHANTKRFPLNLMHWYPDLRFSHLVKATYDFASDMSEPGAKSSTVGAPEDDLLESTLTRVHRRVARALHMPVDDLDVDTPIVRYGIDSLVAGGIRNWLFTTFETKVGMLSLLSPTTTVRDLVDEVEKGDLEETE